jgi:glycine cleavage system transcriptional repressor
MKTRFSNAFVLNVMADDRPGIVAAVSKAVTQEGGNIDACSQTVLEGYFALVIIVSFPNPIDGEQLRTAVAGPPSARSGFQVQVRPFEPPATQPNSSKPATAGPAANFVITAFGPDREGIIWRFSSFLADKGINIIDLYGNRQGDQFVLIGQVQVPGGWDIQMLQADLEHLAKQSGYTVRLQHENVFVATNQLRLTRAVPAGVR